MNELLVFIYNSDVNTPPIVFLYNHGQVLQREDSEQGGHITKLRVQINDEHLNVFRDRFPEVRLENVD